MPVHVREMGAGANAIDAAYRVVGALRELEARWNAEKARAAAFRGRGPPDQPEHRPDRGRRLGLLGAGLVPARTAASRSIRASRPRRPPREIEAAVSAFARARSVPGQQPAARHLQRLLRRGLRAGGGLGGRGRARPRPRAGDRAPLESFMTAGYLDTRVHALYDRVPALCYGPIAQQHPRLRRAREPRLGQAITTTMALFVAEWCGTERRAGWRHGLRAGGSLRPACPM